MQTRAQSIEAMVPAGYRGCGEGCKSEVSRLSQEWNFRGSSLQNYRLFSYNSSVVFCFCFSLRVVLLNRIHSLDLTWITHQCIGYNKATCLEACDSQKEVWLAPSPVFFPSSSSLIWPIFNWICPTMTSPSRYPKLILSSTYPLLLYDNIHFQVTLIKKKQ